MFAAQNTPLTGKSRLERALSLVTDIRAGEGATAVLMLANIFLLLVCYAVIKTVREPLILLGGGAEVRSYAAAGQALLLMGFVPLYGWIASKVDRVKLLVGVTLFFIACIEIFASAVAARVPYVGVAFFIWVGIFNISLVAQFWSFANDLYTREAGERLFPIIVIGMTAGAPLGSKIAATLFRSGVTPQVILQVSATLLALSTLLYVWIQAREGRREAAPREPLAAGNGFGLVFSNHYLRLVAALVILLNVVNTTGEYLVARLLTVHVNELAAADAAFNKQAFIGAFSGDYQFWVNITAFLLQAFVASRLVKYAGLRGALLALPLIALGGYAIIGAGVGFSVVRWIKTAENATDYSIMNTARQLLWLKTTREEKYKAKQAIDSFFVRVGDVLSAGVVLLGTSTLHLTVQQFALVNMALTVIWLGIALRIVWPQERTVRLPGGRRLATSAAAVTFVLLAASAAFAQETREDELAAARAKKALALRPYEPNSLERKLYLLDKVMSSNRPFYPFIGNVIEGSGVAFGPGYRARFGDTGSVSAHASWSIRNFTGMEGVVKLPEVAGGRVTFDLHGKWFSAPTQTFYGIGADTRKSDRENIRYRSAMAGGGVRVQATRFVAVGGALEYINAGSERNAGGTLATLDPSYRRTRAFAEFDWRTSPDYSRSGGLYRVELSDYNQINGHDLSFRRFDAEVRQFIPLLRENWVIALRALASTTQTANGREVPYFLLPDLGGSHEMRGYATWRFRDRNRMLFTAEYRWTAGPFVDMAVFTEAGKVAGRRSDLDLRGLRTTNGIGMSIHTPGTTIARIEVARSEEGTAVTLSFSPSF